MSRPLMIRVLSASVTAASRAGQIIKEVVERGDLAVVQKDIDNPQTEADRRAHRCIVSSLTARFPNVTIISEEAPSQLTVYNKKLVRSLGMRLMLSLPPSEEDKLLICSEESEEVLKEQCPPDLVGIQEQDVVIWVDPLDGTKEFIQGLYENVTVLIGIAVGGTAVGGVIHQPFWSPPGSPQDQPLVGRTVWGMVGLGVRGLRPPTSSYSDKPGLSLVMTWPPYADRELLDRTVFSIKPESVIQVGGGEILMILDNKVDAYVFAGVQMQKWDTCASDAILCAAGGILTDIYGDPLSYRADATCCDGACGLIGALDRQLHSQILGQVPDSVKKSLLDYCSDVLIQK